MGERDMSGRLRRRRHGSANTGMPAGVKPPKPRSGAPVSEGAGSAFVTASSHEPEICLKLFPSHPSKRKLSGSCPGWRLATSCARVLAAAIASSLVVKTQASLSTRMPPLSQSIANNAVSFR
jgi:hypothetical protein